jgi:GDPmannose 4,6-dehydratase
MGIVDKLTFHETDLLAADALRALVAALKPFAIYHLGGVSTSQDSFDNPRHVFEQNVIGTTNLLEAIRLASPETRFFYTSSAEIYGPGAPDLIDETRAPTPQNPYAISKTAAQHLVATYRARHGLFAVTGIMFNHESAYRPRRFVTRKITYTLARLRVEGGAPLELGAFDSCRDWGAAEDYIAAMPLTLGHTTAEDYVFATGHKTPVREFLRLAAAAAGFDPEFSGEGLANVCRDRKTGQTLAIVSPQFFRPNDTSSLIGDPARLKQATGWAGSRDVAALAADMMRADLDRRKAGRIDF